MISVAGLHSSLLMVKPRQVPQRLNQSSMMAYSSLILMMTFGRMWVWMTNMMVVYHGGLGTKGYVWGFKHYSSMIDAVRRRFG